MRRFLALFLTLISTPVWAQGTVSSTCIWSGTVADCLPSAGLLLRDQRDLRLGEATANGSNYVALQAPTTLAGDVTLTLPVDDGAANEFLQTNGSGALSWSAVNLADTDVTGVLPLANGGTNKNATAVNGGLVYSDADSMEITAAGTASQWVLSGGAGTPTMSDTTTTQKRFNAGIVNVGYVGTNPEVGGSTPFQMVDANNRIQVLNPAGDITLRLPTTNILAGEIVTVVNLSDNKISVTSSDSDAVEFIYKGFASFAALINTPTDVGHWSVVTVQDEGPVTLVQAFSGSNGSSSVSQAMRYSRTDNYVTVTGYITITKGTATGNLTLTSLPFTAKTLSNFFQPFGITTDSGITPGANRGLPTAYVSNNSSVLGFFLPATNGVAATALTVTEMAAIAGFMIQGTYITN